MNFKEASDSFYKNFINFRGRATRSEYWWNGLSLCGAFVISYIIILVGLVSDITAMTVIGGVLVLVMFGNMIGWFALSVRRLHDTDRSGWWLLLGFVPFGGIVIFIFTVMPSSPGPNNYGPNPRTLSNEGVPSIGQEDPRFCTHCGAVLRNDVSFCGSCGRQIR